MSKELIKELRVNADAHPRDVRRTVMTEAADALESQALEIERLSFMVSEADYNYDCDRSNWQRELAALKAQQSGVVLPELRELLEMLLINDERRVKHAGTWRQGLHERATVMLARLNSSTASAGWMMPTVKQLEQALESVPSFHDLSAELIAPAMLEHLREVISAGEYGDAYQGARQDLLIWKRRALEGETKVREQDQVIENLGNALNAESGPTFMGEPVMPASAGDDPVKPEPIQVEAVAVTREDEDGELYLDWLLEGGISALEQAGVVLVVAHGNITDDEGSGTVYTQARAALSANHSEQVREGLSVQVCKLGRLGAAYDPADTRYAYTYAEQPDNAHAWRLGEAFSATKPGGDCIDAGLGLLKQLEKRGFGVFQLAAAPSAGSGD